jgi:hypothetical protein
MKRPSARPTPQLYSSLQQRVNAYALAASATGIGVLALLQAAGAKIVYTPANIRIVQNHGLIFFDLNHDGIPDFGHLLVSRAHWTFHQRSQFRQPTEYA